MKNDDKLPVTQRFMSGTEKNLGHYINVLRNLGKFLHSLDFNFYIRKKKFKDPFQVTFTKV